LLLIVVVNLVDRPAEPGEGEDGGAGRRPDAPPWEVFPMGQFLWWLLVQTAMALGLVASAAVVLVGLLSLAAILMAGRCEAVDLRRAREIEAEDERLDEKA